MTDSPDKLTTDPPLPPGTPDVDELVGDPVPTGDGGSKRDKPDTGSDRGSDDGSGRDVPDDEDVASDTVSVEPPD